MRLANRRWAVARILFGLFFLYAPLMVIVQFGGQNPPETMPAASDFASALDRTGFMNPLIIGTMLMGGAALLFRSEEHTSELQSLMRISYAVFCLKNKTTIHNNTTELC